MGCFRCYIFKLRSLLTLIALPSVILHSQNWREYEHLHTLLWLSKDLSWNQSCIPTWILFMIPTFLIALDFIWMTWSTKVMHRALLASLVALTTICCHYVTIISVHVHRLHALRRPAALGSRYVKPSSLSVVTLLVASDC